MSPSRDGPAGSREEPWPSFRVLCVDDHRDCAHSFALLLRAMGFEARACYDAPSALRLSDGFRPAVCFLDLNMPGMAGDELARRLRESGAWRPLLIVGVTAMSNEACRARVEAAGFDLHLVKPVDPGKLVEVVDLLFRAAEAARPSAARQRSGDVRP